jgi:UDP-glucose 4-epimerase
VRALVTGASGRLGRAVVEDLMAHGCEVIAADRRPPEVAVPGARRVELELGDVGQVAGALAGCDGVVHLGAIPAPHGHADEVVFGNNTRCTFGVLQAAALVGVRRAVIASSISALGTAYPPTPRLPLYAPLDEAHPLLPADPYALSKEVDERTGEMFHRRTGMAVAALRFTMVTLPGQAAERAGRHRAARGADAQILWSYVDVRDAAAACRLALEAAGPGFEAFNVTAADTLSDLPTEDLLRRHAPSIELRSPIPGTASAVSCEKARTLLGYEPRHTWRSERPAPAAVG